MRMIDNEGLAKLKWSLGECFESGVVGNGIIALNPSPNLFGRSNRPPPPFSGVLLNLSPDELHGIAADMHSRYGVVDAPETREKSLKSSTLESPNERAWASWLTS